MKYNYHSQFEFTLFKCKWHKVNLELGNNRMSYLKDEGGFIEQKTSQHSVLR